MCISVNSSLDKAFPRKVCLTNPMPQKIQPNSEFEKKVSAQRLAAKASLETNWFLPQKTSAVLLPDGARRPLIPLPGPRQIEPNEDSSGPRRPDITIPKELIEKIKKHVRPDAAKRYQQRSGQ
jgi:hypothetical protein